MNDLITQLDALISTADANQNDAQKWRDLQLGLARLGFGPLFSVEHILALMPSATVIASVAAASWPQEEPVSAPAAAKRGSTMPRRKLTPADEQNIAVFARQGFTADRIAADLNVAKSSVERYLDATHR